MWDGVRHELDDVDVLTVDAPGFGASPSGQEIQELFGYPEPDLAAYARAIEATLGELGIERVVLGGLSMGGATAAIFAASRPDVVAGLALMDTNIEGDAPERREGRLAAIALCEQGHGYDSVASWPETMMSPQATLKQRESLDARLRTLDSDSLAWMHRAMMERPDARQALRQVSGPIALIRGADDPTCSLELLQSWQALAPRAKISEIEGAGHFSANERPLELAAVLRDFYREAV